MYAAKPDPQFPPLPDTRALERRPSRITASPMRVTPLESFAATLDQVSQQSSSQTQTLNNFALFSQITGFGSVAALTGLVRWLGGFGVSQRRS